MESLNSTPNIGDIGDGKVIKIKKVEIPFLLKLSDKFEGLAERGGTLKKIYGKTSENLEKGVCSLSKMKSKIHKATDHFFDINHTQLRYVDIQKMFKNILMTSSDVTTCIETLQVEGGPKYMEFSYEEIYIFLKRYVEENAFDKKSASKLLDLSKFLEKKIITDILESVSPKIGARLIQNLLNTNEMPGFTFEDFSKIGGEKSKDSPFLLKEILSTVKNKDLIILYLFLEGETRINLFEKEDKIVEILKKLNENSLNFAILDAKPNVTEKLFKLFAKDPRKEAIFSSLHQETIEKILPSLQSFTDLSSKEAKNEFVIALTFTDSAKIDNSIFQIISDKTLDEIVAQLDEKTLNKIFLKTGRALFDRLDGKNRVNVFDQLSQKTRDVLNKKEILDKEQSGLENLNLDAKAHIQGLTLTKNIKEDLDSPYEMSLDFPSQEIIINEEKINTLKELEEKLPDSFKEMIIQFLKEGNRFPLQISKDYLASDEKGDAYGSKLEYNPSESREKIKTEIKIDEKTITLSQVHPNLLYKNKLTKDKDFSLELKSSAEMVIDREKNGKKMIASITFI